MPAHLPSAINGRHGSIEIRKGRETLPFLPFDFCAIAFVHQHLEHSFCSELRVLRDDAHVIFLRLRHALLHIARHGDRVDGAAANVSFRVLQRKKFKKLNFL